MISLGNINEFELAISMFALFTEYQIIIDEDLRAEGFHVTFYNSPSYRSYEAFIKYQNSLHDYCEALLDSFMNRLKEE